MSASNTATLSGWRWRQHGKDDDEPWHQCSHSRPTTEIFTDLLDAKIIPDPFLDQNERDVQWVGEADWEYACDFHYEPDQNHSRQDLVFDGLDTVATVYLNGGAQILQSSNMFHRHRVDVTSKLRPGPNTLRIVFRSALHYGRELEAKHGRYRAFNGESSRLHVRKAQYHYGWDWGPLLVTCGLSGEVRLESYASRVNDVFVAAQVSDDLQEASVNVTFDAILDRDVSVDIEVVAPNGEVLRASTALGMGETQGSAVLVIPKPHLWYPVGHGPQVFYSVDVVVTGRRDQVPLHSVRRPVGVRRVRLVQQPLIDEPGTSFFFEVNNEPVYISGSNWIPNHSFLTTLTREDYASAVDLCVKGNQNMLRIWGGGIYEHDALYEECDRRGILVWQDFMFACGQYPCYPEFVASVQREAADQVKRLRQYSCIVLYAGNNEDYAVAEMLGLAWDPEDNSGDWTKTNFPARTLYETHLPAVVSEHTPGVPYHPSSPWGGKGTEDRTVGDIHQWNVWHGSQEKYQLWDKLVGRFVSEFGMLGLPAAKSISRFVTDPAQRYPQSAVLDSHNKADGSERRLALYVMENIRVDSMDLDSWVYATQLVQAECLGFAVRSCRRQWKGPGREYCGGQLVWQLNDCWPCASWSLVDFYGEQKLAYYATKRDSASLALGILRSTPELKGLTSPPPPVLGPPHDLAPKHHIFDVWAVNGTLQDVDVQIEVRLYDIASGVLREERRLDNQALLSNRTTELLEDVSVDEKTAVQAIMRNVGDGRVIARASDWPQPLKYVGLAASPDVSLSVLDGKVELRATAPVKGVQVYLSQHERNVSWEDNGVDVFPDDVYTIHAPELVKGDQVEARYYGSTC
ncbi:beta-mannosidase precursor [Coniochaeta ligniaria NRRL 30616]|uniref:Beta-mannosidase B n=1 Tax=Coniochaeta ligniaria NRRL 30616 TaxID=1408157 RepID=A0A1J7IE44_9PEZI|nr:beta-mannosidase precursor [Coniochaeta ligniaria NRRL 30616]